MSKNKTGLLDGILKIGLKGLLIVKIMIAYHFKKTKTWKW